MATFTELFNLRNESVLLNKLPAPICIKCKAIIDDTGANAVQKDWARKGYENPESLKGLIIWPILIANKDKTVAQIRAATASSIQTNVNDTINDLISGLIVEP